MLSQKQLYMLSKNNLRKCPNVPFRVMQANYIGLRD